MFMFTAQLGGERDPKRFGNRLNIASNSENSSSPPQALRTFHICGDIVNKAKSIKREVHGVCNGGEEFGTRLLKSDITGEESALEPRADTQERFKTASTVSLLGGCENAPDSVRTKRIGECQHGLVDVRFNPKPEFNKLFDRALPLPVA